MAARNLSSTSSSGVDELLFRNDAVSLCLLVNRRHRTLRIIDFRAGPTPSKRNFVLSAAKREGVEKIFTLVERDEVPTWTRLGFVREGSIPGFYKRSDAWILGAVVSQMSPQLREESDDDEGAEGEDRAGSPAVLLAERTIARARRLLREGEGRPMPAIKIAPASAAELRRAVAAAQRAGRALTGFEPFGRDAVRTGYALSARGGFTLHAAWEMQSCFGNSFLEILTSPRHESERLATTAAIGALCERLVEEKAVSTFTFAPADDQELCAALLANGFRRSAVLARHLVVGRTRKDAILWAKKLVAPEA
ncbi:MULTISPECIES: hypothetical protein [Sorangium]|uniref:Uncharacterized protein n=1 Tax=Sorangium cellulosum TaxID=56 RepID=A0A4P2QHT1_SORCE|nr:MULTISPECIES: hypothetical protein [Sorangium]AUX29484.1 hypothetical protein SOCE836_015740 [Sorangium cellulosum]WCQ88880.1 hypothetical protein NQZ70_01562 [Sorangium sp. Soce836]